MVAPQHIQVYPGLAVEALDKGLGNQLAKVFVAGAVFAQQHQVVGVVIDLMHPVGELAPGQIHLAADDGLDARGLGGFVKIDTAVHNAVVGYGDGGLPQLLHPVHHAADAAGSVQEAVFTMDMQVNKTHSLLL